MKKILIIIVVLLVLGFFGKGAFSQGVVEQSRIVKSIPTFNPDGSGQYPYLTHPEITDIMTTTVTVPAQNTDDGYLFVTPAGQFYDGQSALMILENTGEPIYIQTVANDPFLGDFKVQTVNGIDYLTFYASFLPGGNNIGSSYVMDAKYQVIDSWRFSGAAPNDIHDFILLDNGHAIVMAYVLIPYDLSPWGGPVNGTLVDVVIQELDANRNIVFEWVARDHLPIGDTQFNINTTDPLDYLHTNAIEIDDDGNWLLSHRHFSEITKINRQTGDVMWRMGGNGNEFTFTNDIGFSFQHDIRRLGNGNITIFDNGNYHNPFHSRAIEYTIDEVAKTVTRVWAYPDDTSEFSLAMGNHQRLPNGNSFIGWGTLPKVSEVQPDGTLAFEMLLGSLIYRSFRYPWSTTPTETPRAVLQHDTDPTAVTLYTSWNGATDIAGYNIYAGPTVATMSLIGNAPRTGFETIIPLTGLPPDTCFFQTKPVHAQGNPTPYSNRMFRLDLPVCWNQLNHAFIPLTAR